MKSRCHWAVLGGLLGCSAAPVDPPPPPAIAIAPLGSTVAPAAPTGTSVASATPPEREVTLAMLDAARWVASGPAGDAGRWHVSYRFEGRRYTTSGYPPWEESGRVDLVEVDGRRMLLSFTERVYDGQPDTAVRRWIQLAKDGQSFSMGDQRFERQGHAATVAEEPAEGAPSP